MSKTKELVMVDLSRIWASTVEKKRSLISWIKTNAQNIDGDFAWIREDKLNSHIRRIDG